jgi:hypothetical protein
MSTRRIDWTLLIGLLMLHGCDGKTQDSSSNTNWLDCRVDSECGEQVCLCGYCSDPCEGVLDCSLAPEEMCVRDAGATPAPLPALEQLWAHRDPDAQGFALRVANDGSVWVAGGSDRTYFDLSYDFPSYFLARFDAASGALEWEARDASMGTARALALSAQGRVATITTNYVDGDRTTLLERDAQTGNVIASVDILEEANAVLYDDGDRPVVGGSHLLSYVGGRPTSSLWVAGLDETLATAWQLMPESPQLGWTGASSMAQGADGTLFVAGFQGTTVESNASVPWVLGIREGAVAWEHVYDTGTETTGSAHFVAALPEGGALVRGMDSAGSWLRRLSASGETEWTEYELFGSTQGTIEPLADGGYAVTDGHFSCSTCTEPDTPATPLTVTGFSPDRAPVWRVQVDDCELAVAVAKTPDGMLIVLGTCDWGMGLFGYALPSVSR